MPNDLCLYLLTFRSPAEPQHVVRGVSTKPQHVVISARTPLSIPHPHHPLAESVVGLFIHSENWQTSQ